MINLTPEQQKQIVGRLDQLWPKPRICPLCRGNNWMMNSSLVLHQSLHGCSLTAIAETVEVKVNQQGAPAALFYCDACGYIVTFLAAKLGIIPQSEG